MKGRDVMTRAALVWTTANAQRLAHLKDGAPNIVGRAEGSDVLIDDPTVSRRQAVVSTDSGRYVLENVSQTNVATVNGVRVDRPVPLSDGDTLNIGNVQLTFHDLQAGDRLSGPLCSHCSRENMSTDKDCWYCGTSLVNAPTTILSTKKVAFRMISGSGEKHDVHSGETFVINAEGSAEVVRDEKLPAAVMLAVKPNAEKGAEVVDASGTLSINGSPPSADVLQTGDLVAAEATQFLVIVR